MSVMAMIAEPSLEADLTSGRLRCPVCDGPLSPWGFARERTVRLLDGPRQLRPRRARCAPCDQTHVLLPAWAVTRRRDGTEVIGRAFLAKARGHGHRRIAADLGRPAGTVRGWRIARRAAIVPRARPPVGRAIPSGGGAVSTRDAHPHVLGPASFVAVVAGR